ncbi:MAG: Fe-S cluster assembly protein SufD [Bacteroidota bacterium]
MSNAGKLNEQLDQLQKKFNEFETALNGSKGSIHATRKAAISHFLNTGFPTSKNEEYKYTDLSKSVGKSIDFSRDSNTDALRKGDLKNTQIKGLEAHELVFINGNFNADLSNFTDEDGLIVSDFQEALKYDDELIKEHFNKYAQFEKDELIALNTGFSLNGSIIRVVKNYKVSKPIVLRYINDVRSDQRQSFPRNLIIAEESSEVAIIEVYSEIGNNVSFTNEVTEIVVSENAQVDHYKLQLNDSQAFYVGTTQVRQASSSRFSSYTFTSGGSVIRNNLNVDQTGEGCETHMYGLYLINGLSHVDNHTTVDHQKPNSYSNELYKGIIDDKARGVFNGKIYVRPEAQKTNAFQSNKNILLTDTAIVNTKPQLEIWADDVKCSHGCTTGQLDEEALFYMQARGLSKESARALLLYAFATEVLENIKIETVKNYLEGIISDRLYN